MEDKGETAAEDDGEDALSPVVHKHHGLCSSHQPPQRRHMCAYTGLDDNINVLVLPSAAPC